MSQLENKTSPKKSQVTPEGWLGTTLGENLLEIAMGPFGSNIKVETFVDSGVPVISGAHLRGTRVEEGSFKFITPEHALKLKNSNVFRGDIIFTHAGTIGQVAYVPSNSKYERYVISQRQFYLRCNEEKADPAFITYFFHSPEGRHKLLANASQVGVPSISRPSSNLKAIEISLPGLEEQRAISRVISYLDDRIDLLRQTNSTLESIAQALFKSWFVDFDPVRAKAEGREPEGMDAATAALFPSEFEESELGFIPKGWRGGSIGDLLTLQRGFDLPAPQRVDGEFPILAASGPSGHHKEARVMGPGVTTGRSGVLGRVFYVTEDFWPLNTSLWVKDFRIATAEYAYQFLKTMDLSHLNAGSAVPTLNRNHVHGVSCVVPDKPAIDAYTSIAAPLMNRIHQAEKHASLLYDLRDTLLPRLISGKLRLPDVERELAEAL